MKIKGNQFNYCPYCSDDLDTGWECNKCKTDWMPVAYPRWKYYRDKLTTWLKDYWTV